MPRAAAGQQARRFRKTITRTVALDYLLFLPSTYGADRARNWPLMLFLHGAGERGKDLQLVRRHGPPKLVARRKAFPFVVVSPQCPADQRWDIEALSVLLDDIVGRCRIDADRVYLTGLSMGGHGTWALAGAEPDRFAAAVPICGGGTRGDARSIGHSGLPVWAFHGSSDRTVPPAESRRMVRAVKDCGGDARLTVYPGVGHDSWTQTYANLEVYDWMLGHTRTR